MKRVYRIIVMLALASLAVGTGFIGCQLSRLNQHIDFIREQIPMSLLGN